MDQGRFMRPFSFGAPAGSRRGPTLVETSECADNFA